MGKLTGRAPGRWLQKAGELKLGEALGWRGWAGVGVGGSALCFAAGRSSPSIGRVCGAGCHVCGWRTRASRVCPALNLSKMEN